MLIGLVGTIGSGKGSVGDILAERGFFTESFASPLKDITANLFGWSRKLLEGDTLESRTYRETVDEWWSTRFETNITPRLILQLIGTECMRECIHQDFWVALLEKRIEDKVRANFDYVITDVRFPNEIDSIRRMGGKIVEVQRGKVPEWYVQACMYNNGDSIVRPDVHYSEWAWMGYKIDYTINNTDTIEYLRSEVELMIDSLT